MRVLLPFCYLTLLFLLFTGIVHAYMPAKPAALKCEHLVNPIGIDASHPRLSWRLADERTGARQTAYQLFLSTDSLDMQKGMVWQSVKINGSASLVTYAGSALQPFTKYYWRVDVWDKDGIKAGSAIASFETGMMDRRNWKGAWISDISEVTVKPAGQFRKVFEAAKKIRSARAYIAVAGLYELYINGQRIGDHRLDPMYTRFDRRTLYVTYDVTAQLQAGKNAIGVLLGNGWYNHQSTAVWYFHKAPWRARPAFCLDLRITYEDGTAETITSGKDWKTALGPVIFNSIYTAEHYDARLEQPGWNTVNFDDSKWKPVTYRAAPSNNIVAQALHPIQAVEEIAAKTVNRISDTVYVFDLGRNIAGVSRLKVSGEAGTTIRLKHAEQVYANGRADQSNIDVHYRPTDDKDPFQTDIFILSGKAEETFMPRFNYKGFQYVEVTSDRPLTLTKESLTGYFMHSNVPPVGNIKSSNTTIDKIWSATNNAYLSNLFGYPTDCPQREKNGWTGDAQIAIETGLYSFDGITVYEKWLADHRDEQQPNGVLPSIIPTGGWGYEWGNGPDWTSTIAIIPWNIYLFYGDKKLLADCYDNIKLYVDHINELYPSGLTTWGLGDWVPVKSKSPVELTSTAYYFADATILAKAAKLLGKEGDHKKYTALAAKIRDAFNAKYLNKQTNVYGSGWQTELSVALYWGLVPAELKSKVAANLAKRVEQDNFHLDVGLLGTKAILNALSENGYADVAYKLAAQETFPSWGWWIVNGATTLYENWDINAGSDLSRNHIMFGEIGGWFYKGIGGIKPDEAAAGFKHVLLEPHFVEGLDHFEAVHEGPYGNIIAAWKKNAGMITYAVTVPANSTATIYLPMARGQQLYENGKLVTGVTGSIRTAGKTAGGKQVYHVQSGTYRFEIR
ncbi:family 78 glycoside hydrolase catalytic domain [Pseudoflavitalea sp. X16]|uniref:alpha-L-rhamnosidase n=1 Tax=Paraflavitalea devenefica TaxID=2716334 RepID=UPI001420C7E4|nr:alpha-L-rhamnosidase [Paraflavitalea devenefica]NII27098.1 family 78 glycoside hydrolase catalytic domain [Paraflavitalea devenefica]